MTVIFFLNVHGWDMKKYPTVVKFKLLPSKHLARNAMMLDHGNGWGTEYLTDDGRTLMTDDGKDINGGCWMAVEQIATDLSSESVGRKQAQNEPQRNSAASG